MLWTSCTCHETWRSRWTTTARLGSAAGAGADTILRALGAVADNKAEAARLLGISERTLWYKLKRYGL
jgi:transcriptional regulator with PAS, ATPase and Fis domain